MSDSILYSFEELSDDLPRPPMVALRALLSAGLAPSPRGWASLSVDTRKAIAKHGTAGVVDITAVRELAQQIPPRYLKLVSRSRDPNPDEVPAAVAKALGPARMISDQEWRSLRAVDRAVMASLTANSRLIARAYDELAVSMGKPASIRQARWSGAIARCELKVDEAALDIITSGSFLDGRALMLARVAGLRAARRISDTLDLHADSVAGPIELDSLVQYQNDSILWQAHVSTWDGAFCPAGALLAVTTAATALFDMIKDEDPAAHLEGVCVREEAWRVGLGVVEEEATQLYTPGSTESQPFMQSEEVRAILERASSQPATAAASPSSSEPASASADCAKTLLDPPASRPVPADVPSTGTVQEASSDIGAMIDSARDNAHEPLGASPVIVDSPGSVRSPVSSPSPRSVRSSDSSSTSSHDDDVIASPAPKGLVGLFVASLVILIVALGIFGYVLSRSL